MKTPLNFTVKIQLSDQATEVYKTIRKIWRNQANILELHRDMDVISLPEAQILNLQIQTSPNQIYS